MKKMVWFQSGRRRILQAFIIYIMVALCGCNSNSLTTKEIKRTQQVEITASIPDTIVSADTTARYYDTILYEKETLVANSIFEWKAQIKSLNGAFNSISILKDSSFITSINAKAHDGYLASGFYDSKGHRIQEHRIEEDLLFKLSKDGEEEWLKGYYPQHYFISLISYTVTNTDRIVSLVALEEDYFRKLEEERRYELEISESDEDIEEIALNTEQTANGGYYPSFGLEFINNKGGTDSIVAIEKLSPEIRILAFKSLPKNRFVIAGTYYGSIFTGDTTNSDINGNFIAVIDSKGKILWKDIMTLNNNQSSESLYLDVANDGSIYFCSIHYGEVRFSKGGQQIKSKQKSKGESDYWTYLVHYTTNGSINWIRSNETTSNVSAIRASGNGVYIAQKNYGDKIYNNYADTSGHITEFLTFFNTQGNHQWSKGFPVNNIHSIAINNKELPVIMGNYNDRVYSRPLKNLNYGGVNLNSKEDLFVISLDKSGKPAEVWTGNLNLRADYNANKPQLALGADNSVYITCHSENYFKENFNASTIERMGYVGDISFMGKLKK